MSSSSASSTSESPEPSPSPQLKRKRVVEKAVAPDSEGSDSDSSNDNDAPAVEKPALSHAERRRQKKKEELAEKEGKEESAAKKRKLKDGTAAPASGQAKRQNSVWVGNMSFKTTQDNLKMFFDGVGEVTRIHMPTKAPAGPGLKPENRGFAYVDFTTPEAKAAAIARSEKPLLGRKLLIKDGDDFAGRPALPGVDATGDAATHKTHSKTAQKILRAQKQPPAPTLFFGNLGFETTEDAIRQLLEMHREGPKRKGKGKDEGSDEEEEKKPKEMWIRKVRMGTFEDSGLCKGFAFVDFMTTEHATSALINLKNHHLNGRNLVVEYASAEAVRRGAPKGSRPADGAGHRPFTGGQKFKRPDTRQPRDAPPFKGKFEGTHAEADVAHAADDPVEHSSKPKWDTDQTMAGGKDTVRHKGPRSRPKPGAALALAKRESAAIVPSRGQKITF